MAAAAAQESSIVLKPPLPVAQLGAEDFCEAFYHVKATPEAGIERPVCLRAGGECCRGKTTALVATVVCADGSEAHAALHTNTSQREHAEGALMRDARFTAALRAAHEAGLGPLEVVLRLNLQPCHHSSSEERLSCTLGLLEWHRRELRPCGVGRLRIKVAYPYRTHWDAGHMSDDELVQLGRRRWGGAGGGGRGGGGRAGRRGGPGAPPGGESRPEAAARARAMLQSAREGTRLLASAEPGAVSLEPFDEADWAYVVCACCDEPTRRRYGAREAPFTEAAVGARAALDGFTAATFDAYRPQPLAGPV